MQRPSTTLCSRAYSVGSAGSARLTFRATSSDFQYDSHEEPTANTTAIAMPVTPKLNSHRMTATTRVVSITKTAMSSAERRLFWATWSYKVGVGAVEAQRGQNLTLTGPLASPSASKYSRCE